MPYDHWQKNYPVSTSATVTIKCNKMCKKTFLLKFVIYDIKVVMITNGSSRLAPFHLLSPYPKLHQFTKFSVHVACGHGWYAMQRWREYDVQCMLKQTDSPGAAMRVKSNIYTVSQKNDTDLACYNSWDASTNADVRVCYQTVMHFFPPHLTKTNHRNCIYSHKCCILLYLQTQKHIQLITWLQLNHLSLSVGYLINSVNTGYTWMAILSYSNTAHQCTVYSIQLSCCSELHFS